MQTNRHSRRGAPELAWRLQAARRAAGYRSSREACVSHGWSEARYRAHEAGTRRPGAEILAAYAAAFWVSVDWLTSQNGQGPELDHSRLMQIMLRSQTKVQVQSSGPPVAAIRLRLARRLAGYKSASAAATAHGWNRSTYSAHETGQNGLSREASRTYAECFGVHADWLLKGQLPTGWPPAVETRLSDLLALYDTPDKLALAHLPSELIRPQTTRSLPIGRVQRKRVNPNGLVDGDEYRSPSAQPSSSQDIAIGEYELDALREIAAQGSNTTRRGPIRRFTFPHSYLKDVLQADPAHTIIAVMTHDEPKLNLRKGDRLIIDATSRNIGQDGLFVAVANSAPYLIVIDPADVDGLKQSVIDWEQTVAANLGPIIGSYRGRLQAIHT